MRIPRIALLVLAPTLALTVGIAAPAYAAITTTYDPAHHSVYAYGTSADESVAYSCVGGALSPAAVPDPAPCADIESFYVWPAEGADSVDLSGLTASDFPALSGPSVDADDNTHADNVTGSPLPDRLTGDGLDTLSGGDGDDRLTGGDQVSGGPGDDVIDLFSGTGQGTGGPGNDRFIDSLASGGLNGGDGTDSWEVDLHKSTLGSDELPGLAMTFGASTFELNADVLPEPAVFLMVNFEELVLTMPKEGAQTVDASAFPGSMIVRGFGGPDTLIGTANPDLLAGGTGNDTIRARDGKADIVKCGPGNDTAVVDAKDTVVDCETVRYPATATSSIRGPKRISKGSVGLYKFGSGAAGAVFQRKLDAKAWRACASPYAIVANNKLSVGRHKLQVRAGAPAGNWDPTPSKKRFRVVR